MRKQLAAAVVLPLPFVAVPLVAVFIGMRSGGDRDVTFRSTPAATISVTERAIEVRGTADMTYGAAGDSGCREEPGSAM